MMNRDVKASWGKSFEEDLAEQDSGLHSCFIAILGAKVIGCGFIRWAGPRDEAAIRLFPDSPEIYRLDVRQEFRSKGIGTKLIEAMESSASVKGFQSVSLGVDYDNPRAYKLYKRLGFEDTELTEYYDEYIYPISEGKTATARDLCRYLVKQI